VFNLPKTGLSMKNVTKLSSLALATLLNSALEASDKPAPADLLTVWHGGLPIVLAAPHGGREPLADVPVRRGIGVPHFTVRRDSNTAEIAHALAGKLQQRMGAKPFLVIARFERKFVDANRPECAAYEGANAKPYYDAYHRELEAAVKSILRSFGRGLLLDLHGQAAAPETIIQGTENGRSVAALERQFGKDALFGPSSVLGQLIAFGYRAEPVTAGEPERRYAGGYTTQTYGSQRAGGIDAIQLEFGTSLRVRANIETITRDLAQAIENFARAYLSLESTAVPPQRIAQ
jgi:N-formylglutamate amidohydrolase